MGRFKKQSDYASVGDLVFFCFVFFYEKPFSWLKGVVVKSVSAIGEYGLEQRTDNEWRKSRDDVERRLVGKTEKKI